MFPNSWSKVKRLEKLCDSKQAPSGTLWKTVYTYFTHVCQIFQDVKLQHSKRFQFDYTLLISEKGSANHCIFKKKVPSA